MTLDPDEDSQDLMKRKDVREAQLLRAKHLTPEDKIRRASSTTPTELDSTASPASNGSSIVSSSASAKAKAMPAQQLTFDEQVPADMPEKTDGRKRKSAKAKAAPAAAAEPKVAQVPENPKTNAKQSAVKAAPKPKPALPEQPPAVGAGQKPKEELQRSFSLGVNSLLNRGGTNESLGSPPSAEAAAAALETLARTEQKQKEKEEGTESKRRKRDAATHARKNRFYRTLDSRGPWVHLHDHQIFLHTYVHAVKLSKNLSWMSVVFKSL